MMTRGVGMSKLSSLKLIIFFIGLTVVLTIIVVYAWERAFMSPLYDYVGAIPPRGDGQGYYWRVAQRIEHFFISIVVDTVVVSLLLLVVNREQRKLRATDERYRALFEQANDGIGVVSVSDHLLVDANEKFAAISGYQPQAVIGKHVCEMFRLDGHAPAWPLHPAECSPAHVSERELPIHTGPDELSLMTGSGKAIPVSVSGSIVATGRERLLILTVHDLSEQKQLEKEKEEMKARLAQNEKMTSLGRMAAQVAHEVKNPLAGLRLYTLHLKSKVEGKLDPKEMSLVVKIIGGINHLSDIVEKILNFTRPLSLTRSFVDLNRLVTEATNLIEPQLVANRIELKLDLADSPLDALLDQASIRATLINIIVNSIQAMPGGGSLTIKTGRTENDVYLTVADTGGGMSAEQIKNIFEPFYTTKSQGLGLGMSYAWKVVQQHKGTVMIDSQIGKGTSIRIALPVERYT
jgi:PAS domain S-box-containing protein